MTSPKPLVLTTLILASLGAMAMLGPFATDTYLPALPAIAGGFQVDGSRVKLTLSAATVGMAIGQFVLGALSDRLGRKAIIVGGGVFMTAAAVLAALSPSAETLIVLCFIMGLTVSGGLAGGRAAVADLTHGKDATKPFAILGMLLSVGPILGPIGGTVLMGFAGWRAIFVGLAIFAALSTLSVILFVPETLPREFRHPGGFVQTMKSARLVMVNRQYVIHAAILWCGFALMFAYIASSTFIVQTTLGLSAGVYAASFALNGGGLVVVSLIVARVSSIVSPKKLLLTGVGVQLMSIVALLVFVLTENVNPVTILSSLFVLASAMGFVFGPATALAMAEVRHSAGMASALIGSLQFLTASVAAALVAIVNQDALVALVMVGGGAEVFVLAVVIFGAVRDCRRRSATQQTSNVTESGAGTLSL